MMSRSPLVPLNPMGTVPSNTFEEEEVKLPSADSNSSSSEDRDKQQNMQPRSNEQTSLAAAARADPPKQQAKKTMKVSTTTDLNLAQKRLVELVASSKTPPDMSTLAVLYKERYNQKLDHKKLGFKSLKALLVDTPSLHQRPGKPGQTLVYVKPSRATKSKKNKAKSQPGAETTEIKRVVSQEEPAPVLPETFRSFYEFATKSSGDLQSQAPSSSREESSVSDPTMQIEEPVATKAEASDSIRKNKLLSIGDQTAASSFQETALLGHMEPNNTEPVFMNTHIPFCMAAIGVQGAGKSHTLGCILESCLLASASDDMVRLKKPMTALVLHYDQSATSVCEAAGLLSPSPANPNGSCVPRSKAVVLVSPTYYKQRKAFYGDYCTVRPLLFKWSSLTADHIKRIMRIGSGDNQLYVASFMTLLRGYQRKCVVPEFTQFIEEVKEMCNIKGQSGPLDQRIALLESIIAESEMNADIVDDSMDLSTALSSDLNLIIVDMTDPLLSKEEANSLFQVVTEQFRSIPVQGGKLLALDEAHKFMDGVKSDGLSEAIVNVARLMRHDGIRLAVSTQSPKALAPELLELVSVAVLHHFHSSDWWTYIRQKLPVRDDAFEDVLTLDPGNALVFASRHSFATHLMRVCVRPRLTADFGASRTNK